MNSSKHLPSGVKPEVYPRNAHSISRQDIDPDAIKIMYRLLHNGYKAFLVGGGVRDLVLKKKPKDFDIGTDATPRTIKSLFRNSRIIGRRFKLVHIFFRNNKIIEVSTFRDFTESFDPPESSPSTPENSVIQRDNKFGTEATDALRRDITINGLFYDLATFSIIDYVGGMRDLRDGIIRVIGDPDVRFAEDPVRLLRVVRHAARNGFIIEQECRSSIARNHTLILSSVPMRVFEEIKKDLLSGHIVRTLLLLAETELLQHLMPELMRNDFSLLSEKSGLCRALSRVDERIARGSQISATVVLSLLAVFAAAQRLNEQELAFQFADTEDLSSQLKLLFPNLAVPRKERERIETILSAWYILITNSEKRRMRNIITQDLIPDLQIFLSCLGYEELAESLTSSSFERTLDERDERGRRPHSRRGRNRGRHRGRENFRRIKRL